MEQAQSKKFSVTRPSYELALKGGTDQPWQITAQMRSALLDTKMHRHGNVSVVFPLVPDATSVESWVLSGFQLDSTVEYLNSQNLIRATLEHALDAHLAKLIREGDIRSQFTAWEFVRVSLISFEPRRVITPEDVAYIRKQFPNLPNNEVERRVALSDTSETTSKFTIYLEPVGGGPHIYLAEFRDGHLLELQHEGDESFTNTPG